MNPTKTWRTWLPWVALGLAVVGALVAAGAFFILRAFDTPVRVGLAVALVGLAAFVYLEPERVRRWLTGREARYGSNALVLSLAFIGILAALNYLASLYPQRWDLTEDRRNTLAPEIQEVLRALDEPVTAYAFYSANINRDYAREVLDKFALASEGKFTYKFVDPIANPALAQQYGVTRDGTVVLVMGDRHEQVLFLSDEEIANALARLMRPEERVVVFVTGHGEGDIETLGETGYSLLKDELTNRNFTVRTWSLPAEGSLPEDADVVIFAGPTQPFTDKERQVIQDYLANGGSVIFLFNTSVEGAAEPDADLQAYLADQWFVQVDDTVVVDTSSPQQPLIAVGIPTARHPVTQKLAGLVVLFPVARSVRALDGAPATLSVEELLHTTDRAWAETDLAAFTTSTPEGAQVAYDEGEDLPGPVPLVVVAHDTLTDARIVVVGDADFARNGFYQAYGNGLLLLDAVDWAAGQENLITITPKPQTQRYLKPLAGYGLSALALTSICLLPGVVLVIGGVVWFRRRMRR
ncbi:MAG: GldG family protein [Chloroflexi bacterium]|nr:GldG family protein [Chloroflexota bacterium]